MRISDETAVGRELSSAPVPEYGAPALPVTGTRAPSRTDVDAPHHEAPEDGPEQP